jgi:hypothetical protein
MEKISVSKKAKTEGLEGIIDDHKHTDGVAKAVYWYIRSSQ